MNIPPNDLARNSAFSADSLNNQKEIGHKNLSPETSNVSRPINEKPLAHLGGANRSSALQKASIDLQNVNMADEINKLLSIPVNPQELKQISDILEKNLKTVKAPTTLQNKEVQRNIETVTLAHRVSQYLCKKKIPHIFTARSHANTAVDVINKKVFTSNGKNKKLTQHQELPRRGYQSVQSIRATDYDDDEHETYGNLIFSGSTNILDYSPSESALSYLISGKSEYELENQAFAKTVIGQLPANVQNTPPAKEFARQIQAILAEHAPELPNRSLNLLYYSEENLPSHLIMSEPFGGIGELDSKDHTQLSNTVREENNKTENQNSCAQVRGLLPNENASGVRIVNIVGKNDRELTNKMKMAVEQAVEKLLISVDHAN